MKNEGNIDRAIRLIIGEILFLVAFFWFAGAVSIVFYILAIVLLITAVIGFCPMYKALNFNTLEKSAPHNKVIASVATSLFLVVLFGGIYASVFFTKKIFVEDFNAMNGFYKQTLFETGQEKRLESVKNYDSLILAYAKFQNKYSSYKPYAFRDDIQFENDLNSVHRIILGVDNDVRTGDLKKVHLELEKIRPIMQEIFKRNGFSMLAITLVDFHDSMEKVLDMANAKNAPGVIATYAEADIKLLAIEQEADDNEIQTIRKNLDTLLQLAKEGKLDQMPAKAGELKSSFVKVYLIRG
ncbi:MAG TPA: hypothetical protein DEA89_00830 [Candidatus Moranbacteria bacterium]|nr:hypothetical protein [Candidatus Moranbacteria bacterium]HBI51110.1 hypothetical protein [Candidatus Moranbacteria bacterium]HBU10451.1 hypothetical protein [Candidatus Moranbacteria bacterium]HCO99129.1 hypothetical protein [Candidatus Moranbacteria bacterium]